MDWRSKKEGDFSLARMVDRIVSNRGAKPLRHICTISSSSMMTLIDLRASHSSLIFKELVIDVSLCWILFNSCRSGSLRATVLAAKIYSWGCPKLLLAFLPLGYNWACDHERLMLNNTTHDWPLAHMLGDRLVLGWVGFHELLRCSSNSQDAMFVLSSFSVGRALPIWVFIV